MSFKDTLRTAALANAGLAALIGTQWYDTQLPQTVALPPTGSLGAVVVQGISNPRMYSFTQRMSGSYARYQFTVWGGQFSAGAENRDAIASALVQFLDQFNAIGIAGLSRYPNFVVGDRDSLFPQTDGPIFQKVVDAMMFSEDPS